MEIRTKTVNYKEIDENTPLPEIEQVTEQEESEGTL